MATSIGVKLKMDGESEFRKGLQNIVSETKSLDKQLGALESSFDDNKKSLEENAKQTELLEKKKEALQKQIEETSKALEYAKQNYEEGSKEISSWEGALADAEKALNETNSRLQENADYQAEATSAYGQLTSEIESQQSELESLRDAYIDAVLQFGEGSDEANALAGQISNLSSELQNNQARLDEATAAADGLTGSLGEVEGATEEVGSSADEQLIGKFVPAFGNISSAIESAGIVGAIAAIASAAVEAGKEAIKMADDWQTAMNNMKRATGATGQDLTDLQEAAHLAYLSVQDASLAEDDFQAIGGTLNTRLGLTGSALTESTILFAQFASALGVDGVDAVNDLVDVMRVWGLESADDAENIATLNSIMDLFTVGQTQGKLTVDEITSSLTDQYGAWDSLDYSMEDVVALLAAYTDASGSASDISSAAERAVRTLAGTTDDMRGAWDEAINTITNADDRFSVLDETIGDTGVTISSAFGKSGAGQMIDTFKDGKVQTENYSAAIKDSDGAMIQMYNDTRTLSDEIDHFADQTWQNMMDINNQTKSGKSYTDDYAAAWENLGSIFGGTSNDIDDMADSMDDAASSMSQSYNNIYEELSKPIPLHVTAPAIDYGTTTITPTSGGRYTFAKAYDQAMILTAPTIFGAMGNDLLVGGDRPGNEIVVGEQHLLDLMSKAVSRTSNLTVNVFGAEGQSEEALADAVIDKLQREILGSEAVYA